MTPAIVGTDGSGVALGVACVQSAGVLLYPTETVYGLGGDALDAGVLDRIRRLKGSDSSKPVLVLTDAWDRVEGWMAARPAALARLRRLESAMAVTLLVPASADAPAHLIGEAGLVGVRRTSDPFCLKLIRQADCPLLSTSANRSGDAPPARYEDVDPTLLQGVDLVVRAEDHLLGVPSTIVRLEGGDFEIVREGAVSSEMIHEILG